MTSNKVLKMIIQNKISQIIKELGKKEYKKFLATQLIANLDEIYNLIKDIK